MNKRAYRFLLIVAVIMAAMCMIGCESTKPDSTPTSREYDITFSIVNNTEDVITSGSVRRPGSGTGDANLQTLFTQTLAIGDSVRVTISSTLTDSQGRSYLRLTADSGVQYFKLCPVETVTNITNGVMVIVIFPGYVSFEKTDVEPTSPRIITIDNNTGSTISGVKSRWPGRTSWVSIPFEGELPSGNSSLLTIPKANMDNFFHMDIQLCAGNDVVVATILDQLITHKSTLTFEADMKVSVINNTPDPIASVWLKHPSKLVWTYISGEIAIGQTALINIPHDVIDTTYTGTDIELRTANDVIYTKMELGITNNENISFTITDLDPSSPLQLTIDNATGITINTVQVRIPNSPNWTTVSTDGSNVVFIPRSSMDTQFRSDIMLRNSLGVFYTKSLQRIDHHASISFTAGDIAATSPIPVYIENNTGGSVASGYIKHPNSDSTSVWVSAFTSSLANGDKQLIAIPLAAMDNQRNLDVQLRPASGVYFAKLSQPVSHATTITLSGDDVYYIGTKNGEGFIFHDKGYESDGWRFLEVAGASSEFLAAWGLYGVDCTGTSTALEAGPANTTYLTSQGGAGTAAQRCDALTYDGKSDWYLPSRDELDLIYKNLAANGFGGFKGSGDWPTDYYWSSSADGLSTWCQNFNDGTQYLSSGSAYRTHELSVRAVRRY